MRFTNKAICMEGQEKFNTYSRFTKYLDDSMHARPKPLKPICVTLW